MSSIKCPNYGLINFASAETCKRCKQIIEAPAYPYWQGNNAVAPPEPDWSKLQTVPAADLADYGDRSHTVGNILFAIYLVYCLIQGVLMWGVAGEMSGKRIPQFEAGATQMYGGIATCVISILITFIWFRYFNSSKRARAVFAW